MRQNWLSSRVFESDDDIAAYCCQPWTELIDQFWRIISLGLRDWNMISDQRGLA